jgi:tripartite-type tricarboxylate transporter receptor subunit TctC
MIRKLLIASVVIGVCIFLLPSHWAFCSEPYPTKAIDIIVPYSPGGGTDNMMRVIATYLSPIWKVPINIVNKPGGGGIPGTREALIAKPDGYTMLGEGHATSSFLAAFQQNLPFDWTNRTWICRAEIDPVVFVVRPDAPWNSLKEIADFAKKNPKSLRFGSTGGGGISYAAGGQFVAVTEIPMANVNWVFFPAGSAVATALAGSHIDFGAQQMSEVYSLIMGKRLKPLALIYPKRSDLLPDVPTVAEQGYSGIDAFGWHGIAGPPGLPEAITNFWITSMEKASSDPAYIDKVNNVQKIVNFLAGKPFKDWVLNEDYPKYLALAKKLGIRK